MTTLLEARAALLRINPLCLSPANRADAATLADYLDNMVPLNVENNNLMQRLALAEGFVATIRDQAVMAAARIIKPVVLPTGKPALAMDAAPSCTSGWYKGHTCDCIVCRVRANA